MYGFAFFMPLLAIKKKLSNSLYICGVYVPFISVPKYLIYSTVYKFNFPLKQLPA